MFDGIAEKVISSDLSSTKGKQLYFDVFSNSTIRIFFTSFTVGRYVILGHFISESDFLINKTTVYLDYSSRVADKKKKENKSNYYEFYKYAAGSTLFVVSSEDVKQHCSKNCILTLAVYFIGST